MLALYHMHVTVCCAVDCRIVFFLCDLCGKVMLSKVPIAQACRTAGFEAGFTFTDHAPITVGVVLSIEQICEVCAISLCRDGEAATTRYPGSRRKARRVRLLSYTAPRVHVDNILCETIKTIRFYFPAGETSRTD